MTNWVRDEEALAKKEGRWTEDWHPGKTPPNVEEAALSKALEAAFGGWDQKKWDRLEAAWKEFL